MAVERLPSTSLLRLDGLSASLDVPGAGPKPIISSVDLDLDHGRALGLVGESGSGKSMTLRAIMRLLPPRVRVSGDIEYLGASIHDMDDRELARFRASEVGMIHQDPRSHVNPLDTIGDFLTEGVVSTGRMTRRDASELAIQLMLEVDIADGPRRLTQHAFQLSGGLLQRMMIISALMNSPRLLLADEPTTALDVIVQSEVMGILDHERTSRGLSMIFVTHDLDLAAAVTDDLAVMYAGTIVEHATAESVVGRPRHPYTAGLLASRPRLDVRRPLRVLPGRPVSATEVPSGCVFASRCPFATTECRDVRPQLRQVAGGQVACHRAEEIGAELAEWTDA